MKNQKYNSGTLCGKKGKPQVRKGGGGEYGVGSFIRKRMGNSIIKKCYAIFILNPTVNHGTEFVANSPDKPKRV